MNEEHKTKVEMIDRISDLPNGVLIHILSFLPIKEAVATSLLAKRWTPLWRSLPTLDLKPEDYKSLAFYHQFVDKVLTSTDLRSVKKFVLWFNFYKPRECFGPQKISEWIDAVMSNKVEHLELHLRPDRGYYELPSSVFTSKTIKVMKLTGVWELWCMDNIGVTVGALSHVNLPVLEALHLEAVRFPDFRSLEMLLSSCPSLKDLVLKNLYGKFHSPLDIGGFNQIVTAEAPQSLLPLKVFSNVTILRLHMPMIYQPSPLSLDSDTPTFHNLTNLEIEYSAKEFETILKLMQSCPNLENLVIHQFDCGSGRMSLQAAVSRCVSLNLKEFHLANYRDNDCDESELARSIMNNARIISTSHDCYCRESLIYKEIKILSPCLTSVERILQSRAI